ncbi:MAG TPA: ATP-binding protein [Azonexus sp.]
MDDSQRLTGQSTVDRLSRRSTLIFLLLALVAVFTYFLLASETADERASAAEINYAGKRRMLSQRIGLLSSQYLHERRGEDLIELAGALKQIAAIHAALAHGDPKLGLRPPHTDELRARYGGPDGLNATMDNFLAIGREMLQRAVNGSDFRDSAGEVIRISSGELLVTLDQLVDQYQVETEAGTDTLRLTLWCALLAALALLGFSAFGVLRPLITQVRRSLDEQYSSAKALRQVVEKNRLILQAAGEGIFGVDRSGRISFANPAAAALLGSDSSELLALPSHHDIMHTSGACPICQVLEDGRVLRRSDGQFRRRDDAAGFPVEYTVAPRPDGEGAVVSFRDISERRQAEAKLQRFQQRLVDAIEALDDAFALFDDEDRLRLYNLRFTEAFPLRGEIIRIGMHFPDFIRAIAEQQFYAVPGGQMEEWIAQRLEVHRRAEGSCEIPLAGGRWLRATERRTREGGTVVIWTDVSHLKQALIAADQASRAKSEFMARMSHELRTPLNAILGFAQVLEKGLDAPLSAGQLECTAHILQGGRHLLALINEVLDLSAIEAGHLHIEMEGLALAPLLKECVALVSPQAVDRQVRLEAGTAAGLHVRGDRKRLKQVLLNLLSNGIKYNRVGGRLTLTVAESTDGIRLTVADTGQGIAPDMAQRVFQPFDRLGVNQVEGTGIGLSITRRLVELMGGRIGFDSVPGVGTTFWVDLEAAAGEYSADAEAEAAPAAPLPAPAPAVAAADSAMALPSEPCVLAIGLDSADSDMLRLIVSTLRGTRLIAAASLPEARAILNGQSCRAVVADTVLVHQLLADLPPAENQQPFVIAIGERPHPRYAQESRIGHWQPKPMKIREIARILREATSCP